ncbi:MAG: tRNA pseudouridine(38-40) synthase TruA [Flavobacteriales bacterium]
MPQYFFRIRFLGTHYHGWQIQKNARTVQGELDHVLKQLFALKEVRTLGCGRTDKGVHANEFFFSFWTEPPFDRELLRYKMNNFLPPDIALLSIHEVSENAHVRFDPKFRTYEYRIHRYKDPFLQDRSYFFRRALRTEPMEEAASLLPGFERFGAFAKARGGAYTDICTVEWANWDFEGGKAVFRISADRFLRGMVRALAGTMLELGMERYGIEHFKRIVASRDRKEAGRNLPAHGLFLEEVSYPYPLGP